MKKIYISYLEAKVQDFFIRTSMNTLSDKGQALQYQSCLQFEHYIQLEIIFNKPQI